MLSYFIRYIDLCGRAKTVEYATRGHVFFRKRRKKSPFSKIVWIRVDMEEA